MGVTKPYEFIGFGAMGVTKPYEFIGFGAIGATKPYKFIRFGVETLAVSCLRFGLAVGLARMAEDGFVSVPEGLPGSLGDPWKSHRSGRSANRSQSLGDRHV
jgi:hypothetical protein